MAQPRFEQVPPARPWREDDLRSLPEDGHRYEIIDGSLLVTPPADDEHHELADEVRSMLRRRLPPGWRVIREVGLRLPSGNAIPDITVLRPGAARGVLWHEPDTVALVVEVESPSTRRQDRFTKPLLYAEADIAAYWRIERGDTGPVVYVYRLARANHYELFEIVNPEDRVKLELPFPVDIVPADWQTGV